MSGAPGAGGSSSFGSVEEMDNHHHHSDSGGGGSGTTTVARRCAACKYLRRRCAPDCVLAPYFPASQPRRYADVHAVFGTSNVTRVLQSLPVGERGQAADTMATEAHWRVQDPVYGCTGIIHCLQQEIRDVQHRLATTRAQLAMHVHGTGGTAAPPLAAAAAADVTVAVNSGGGHRVISVHEDDDGEERQEEEDEDQAPLMDPDEFLDLDVRF